MNVPQEARRPDGRLDDTEPVAVEFWGHTSDND